MRHHQPRALLALALNGKEDHLIRYAVDLCERSKIDLELCHVVQNVSPYVYEGSYFPETLLPSENEDMLKKEAEDKLRAILERQDTDVICDCSVKVGWLEHSLVDHIKHRNISLLITGRQRDYHSFLKRVTSSLVSLSKVCPVPVLVVPHEYNKPFPTDPKILLADSMSGITTSALNSAFQLAKLLKNSKVFHVHVCEELRQDIELIPPEKFEMVFEALSEGQEDESFQEMIGHYLKTRMIERCGDLQSLKHSGSEYEPILLFGKTGEEIAAFHRKVSADITVTGGHFKSLLTKLFYKNQLPFEDQVSSDSPVLIVPQKYQEDVEFSLAA